MSDQQPPTDNEGNEVTVADFQDWLVAWVAKATNVQPEAINIDRPMEELGLASRDAVTLAGDIEEKLGITLTATMAYAHPTIRSLAVRLIEGAPDEPDEDDDAEYFARERSADDDIAIVGYSTRFPGGGETPESTWELLIAGGTGVGDLPEDRWAEFKEIPRARAAIDAANTQGGYLANHKAFDADFFQMSPKEAEMVDPQQRLALELTWEALEQGRIPASDLKGHRVGVFMGSSTNDYQLLASADPESVDDSAMYALQGTSTSIVANRVSYFYDFKGPSVAIDTACSSALVAIHQAVRSLRSGESEVAVAGGVNYILTPAATLAFDRIGVQSKKGRIAAFSADADGMVRSDGGGVVVLKRIADARRDGDQILAVVAGSAYNSDGRSNGLFAPNPEAQVECLRQAYHDAAIAPSQVDYIDAHGTGTVLGDPLEADALGRVVGKNRSMDKPLLLGSAKTNFGHLEAGAGMASLAKVLLALQHNTIPASINYTEPNPYIQFGATGLQVVTEPTPIPRYSGHAVIGVTGNGFGGTNAHVVLREVLPSDLAPTPTAADDEAETATAPSTSVTADSDDDDEYLTEAERFALAAQAPAAPEAPAAAVAADDAPFGPAAQPDALVPLVLSGFLPSRRRRYAQQLLAWLESDEGRTTPLVDIGRSLAHRNHARSRSVVLAHTYEEAVSGVRAVAEGKTSPQVLTADSPDNAGAVWVFSGFGGQHQHMGKALYEGNPVFAAAIDEIDPAIEREIGWSIKEIFLTDDLGYENIGPAGVGIFAIQIGLAAVLQHHGANPGAIIGQSVGEIAAAYVSGGLSLADAVRVVSQRQRLMDEGERTLSGDNIRIMALVEIAPAELETLLADYPGVEIAVHNSPTHLVIGGPAPQVTAIVEKVAAQGKLARSMHTRGASHTSQMDPLLGELSYELAGIEPRKIGVSLYSSVNKDQHYRPGNPPIHDIDYWLNNLRHTVYFSQGVQLALTAGHTTFIELAAHPIVLMSVAATAFASGVTTADFIETLNKKKSETDSVIEALAKLYVHGEPVNVASLFGRGEYANIPRTTFERKDHWLTVRVAGTGSSVWGAPGAQVHLSDGRSVFEVPADIVDSLESLVALAAKQALGVDATVTALAAHGAITATGDLITTVSPHLGGASVVVQARRDGAYTTIAEAVVSTAADARAVTPPVVTPAPSAAAVNVPVPTQVSEADLVAAPPSPVPSEVPEPDASVEVGQRWTPDSGESIEDRLVTIVSESMGYDREDLPREIPLIELGLDSLMAMRIKNRVEWEFDIPPLQLQAMRDASLRDVVKFVTFGVEHRAEMVELSEHSDDAGLLDAAKLSAMIDEANADPSKAKEAIAKARAAKEAGASAQEALAAAQDPAATEAAAQEPVAAEAAAQEPAIESADPAPAAPAPAAPVDATSQEAVAAAAGSDVPPRDQAERLTFSVWINVVGTSPGGIFNRLPVLSDDVADKLADKLAERAGGEIDVEDVIDSDTIETLADYVRRVLDSGSLDGFVRTLRAPSAGSTRAPLILFHPAGGSTLAYEPLVKRLPADLPVYGFERLEGPIDGRVESYLERLKELQPTGPYVVGGWSLGGALAFEVAQLLTKNGDDVALIVNLDFCRPNHPVPDTPATRRERIERYFRFAQKTYGIGDIPLPIDQLVEADDDERFRITMDLLKASGASIPGGIIEHQRTSGLDNRAMADFNPQPYSGAMVLYRADRMHDGAVELEPEWGDLAPDGRWGEVVDDLEVIHIGGDHLQLIDEPYIATIGADLTRRLDAIAAQEQI